MAAKQGSALSEIVKALRGKALQYPEAVESIACAGTALERGTIKARSKAFLFFRAADMMVKLGASLTDATALAAKAPERCKVGTRGWVTVTFGDGAPPLPLLEKWVDESYRLIASKQLVAMLDERTDVTGSRASPPRRARRARYRRPPRGRTRGRGSA